MNVCVTVVVQPEASFLTQFLYYCKHMQPNTTLSTFSEFVYEVIGYSLDRLTTLFLLRKFKATERRLVLRFIW